MGNLRELIDLLLSPLGLGAGLLFVVWCYFAVHDSMARWFGLGVAMYAASLQKFFDPFIEEEWFPFVGPIETMVQNGRPLAIICLLALLVVSLLGRGDFSKAAPPKLMWPVHAIQVVLLAKMVTGTVSMGFIAQAGIVYVLVAALGMYGVRNWLHQERSLKGPAFALCVTAMCYCLATEFQLRVDSQAVILGNGRLIGTCGNPQHAATLLAVCLPGPLYFLAGGARVPMWAKVLAVVLLISMAHLLFLTGSRTGTLMSLISLLLFFRSRTGLAVIVGGAVYATHTLFFDPDQQSSTERLASLEDTRTHVWEAQWRTFLEYPLFGAPVTGDRLGFGENSWLALMSTAGVVGAAVLGWLLVSIIRQFLNLLRMERMAGKPRPRLDFCMAGLAALFVGSFLEAYLLGIITLPILALLTYSASSERVAPDDVTMQVKAANRKNARKRKRRWILGARQAEQQA